MDSPSFKGFQSQLDCKLIYGNRNQAQRTLLWYIKFCQSKTKQNKT